MIQSIYINMQRAQKVSTGIANSFTYSINCIQLSSQHNYTCTISETAQL